MKQLPEPKTQTQATLYYLIQKRSLTSIELRNLTLSSYPPARIADLQGIVSINSVSEPYTSTVTGKPTTIARYNLETPMSVARKIYLKMIKEAA